MHRVKPFQILAATRWSGWYYYCSYFEVEKTEVQRGWVIHPWWFLSGGGKMFTQALSSRLHQGAHQNVPLWCKHYESLLQAIVTHALPLPADMQSLVQSLIVLEILCHQPLTEGVLLPMNLTNASAKLHVIYYGSVNHQVLVKCSHLRRRGSLWFLRVFCVKNR